MGGGRPRALPERQAEPRGRLRDERRRRLGRPSASAARRRPPRTTSRAVRSSGCSCTASSAPLRTAGRALDGGLAGCGYLNALTMGALHLVALLIGRHRPALDDALAAGGGAEAAGSAAARDASPSATAAAQVSPLPSMLSLVAIKLKGEVESHCHGASLASEEVALLLQRLSLLETVLLDHGVAAEHAELLRADAIHKLFRAWVAEQKGNVSTVGGRALSHETWQPLAETQREASSLVDLFQCLSQTVDVFLSLVQPSSEMASHFERLLNMVVAAIFEYTSEVLRQCGSYEDVLAVVANWSYSGGGGGGGIGGIGGIGGSSFSSSAHKPRGERRAPDARAAERARPLHDAQHDLRGAREMRRCGRRSSAAGTARWARRAASARSHRSTARATCSTSTRTASRCTSARGWSSSSSGTTSSTASTSAA